MSQPERCIMVPPHPVDLGGQIGKPSTADVLPPDAAINLLAAVVVAASVPRHRLFYLPAVAPLPTLVRGALLFPSLLLSYPQRGRGTNLPDVT
jgi:hypothetical protein